MGSGEKLALCHIRRHGFCCKLEAPCAFLIAEGIAQAYELPAYSKRAYIDR
jgi:hypothetical protein